MQPAINPFEPFAFTQTDLNPAIRAEFAHAVYRFGHSMLTETIRIETPDRRRFGRETPDTTTSRCSTDSSTRRRTPRRRARRCADRRGGRRQHHHGHVRPGRQRARRVRHRDAAQQPARPAAGPADDQHDAGPVRGHPAAERPAPADLRRDQRRPADPVHQLGRLRGEPQAPGVAGQLRRGLRPAPDHPDRRRPTASWPTAASTADDDRPTTVRSTRLTRAARRLVNPLRRRTSRPTLRVHEQRRRLGEQRRRSRSPVWTTSTCGSVASPRSPPRSAGCSAPRSTTCSRTS